MKRTEEVFREILYQSIEKKNKVLTQTRLSKELKVSLSNVNLALKQLEKMGAVSIKQRNFHVINAKKILLNRNPSKPNSLKIKYSLYSVTK